MNDTVLPRDASDGVSIIIPFCNNAGTIAKTLSSLEKQVLDMPVEVLLVDAESNDDSVKLASEHAVGRRWPVKILKGRRGLAYNYNLGLTEARYGIVVTMHADCYVESSSALKDIIRPFSKREIVAVTPKVRLPARVWDQMPFWDKVAGARFIGKFTRSLSGKFDAIRHSVLTNIGGFDSQHFFSAGEDVDMQVRLERVGVIVYSDVEVVHAHHYVKRADMLWSLLKKQVQLGQGTGAVIHKQWRWFHWESFASCFFSHVPKLFLCLGVFIPVISSYALALLFLFGIIYSWRVFCMRDIRILIVPFVNIMMFYCFTSGLITGLVLGRQRFQ
ncbi:MAG: glycosyltransferase [Kiritimatiellia bacterium]|jgi:glycosyltransferase involved in cell wall biosynthesis